MTIEEYKQKQEALKEADKLIKTIDFCKSLDDYKDKKILIVGHSTALASLLTLWCDVDFNGDYKFNNKAFFDGKWNYCQCFKLTFNNNMELIYCFC